MRIEPKTVVQVTTADAQKPQPKLATGTTPPAHGSSVVALSTAGAAVTAASDHEAKQTAKIEKLRAMVETGTYKVDLETLASRIVDDEVMRGTPGKS
jgi:flagellar biosynthesis anti-sigma factor FlgM